KAARWMRGNVRASTFRRRHQADGKRRTNRDEEGKRLCVELIQQVRAIEGVAGVHVMAYRREHLVSEIVQESGVLEGRKPIGPRRVRARA
ncbi:MAG: methylenetetrahydrofolate reductase, partial [Rhizobiales bacterium]|nr:methylenetetrahydrofolate reductase [Hyphomicrobiales bacterium]